MPEIGGIRNLPEVVAAAVRADVAAHATRSAGCCWRLPGACVWCNAAKARRFRY